MGSGFFSSDFDIDDQYLGRHYFCQGIGVRQIAKLLGHTVGETRRFLANFPYLRNSYNRPWHEVKKAHKRFLAKAIQKGAQ